MYCHLFYGSQCIWHKQQHAISSILYHTVFWQWHVNYNSNNNQSMTEALVNSSQRRFTNEQRNQQITFSVRMFPVLQVIRQLTALKQPTTHTHTRQEDVWPRWPTCGHCRCLTMTETFVWSAVSMTTGRLHL